ncbi:DUF3558 domain-containing protein [Allosaccharopolyspora coralli]|uniref:DUF3558 domain-containing protein n=1 Tax=Allosaccharopolyspora coralli TaxID=2665642 RepID=A0A5Q3QHE7_9PSEU|nr:DUF3558 domain-containing protein [Allosaccharopolyspora coralli]
MSLFARLAGGVLASAALFAVASCGVSAEPDEAPQSAAPSENALSALDPCSVVPPEKLESLGYSSSGRPVNQLESEPGCRYRGEDASLRVYRNAEETVDSYSQSRSWEEYAPVNVGSREARRALTGEDKSVGGVCSLVISSGGGIIRLDGTRNDPTENFDACGELERVAQAIESDLPK